MIAIRQPDRPYTAEDLAEMPDDGRRYEVIGGELIVSPSPSERHQRVSMKLSLAIAGYLTDTGAGLVYAAPFDVALGEHDILQPDLAVVLKEHAERLTPAGVDGPPDLVIEIISASSTRTDRIRKSATYATFGVPEYWIVDPDAESILAQELINGQFQPFDSHDGLLHSKHTAGLVLDPGEIFSMPDWLVTVAKRSL